MWTFFVMTFLFLSGWEKNAATDFLLNVDHSLFIYICKVKTTITSLWETFLDFLSLFSDYYEIAFNVLSDQWTTRSVTIYKDSKKYTRIHV